MSAAVAHVDRGSDIFLFRVPVLGLFLRDAARGKADAKYYLVFNIAILLFWSFYAFGYAALIIYALTGTFCMLTFLVILTSMDFIENIGKPRPRPAEPKRGARQA